MKDLARTVVLRHAREHNADAEYIGRLLERGVISEPLKGHWFNTRLECRRLEMAYVGELERRFAEDRS